MAQPIFAKPLNKTSTLELIRLLSASDGKAIAYTVALGYCKPEGEKDLKYYRDDETKKTKAIQKELAKRLDDITLIDSMLTSKTVRIDFKHYEGAVAWIEAQNQGGTIYMTDQKTFIAVIGNNIPLRLTERYKFVAQIEGK